MDNATLASPAAAVKSNMPNERGWAQITTSSSPAAAAHRSRLDIGDLELVVK
jgi:hypothetical protein